VKKVSKAILIGLAVLLALGTIMLVGLNLYVQSPGAQARIQEELSKALHLPLKLTNTSVTPWSDLRITGITIPNGGANFLEASAFTARYRLLPLLDGKLIITEMSVESPKIVWAQNAEKKWKMPEPEEAAAVAVKEENNPAVTTGTPALEKPKKEKKEPAKPSSFQVVVNRFDVKNGTVELFDQNSKRVATLTDVNMTYTSLTAERVEGTATIGKVVWADVFTLENFRSPFKYAGNEFTLPEITATLAGGSLRGQVEQRTDGAASPFKAAFDLDQLDLDRIMTEAGAQPGQAAGKLSGHFEMHGDAQRTDKADGTGHLEVRNGQFRQLEFFQGIGQALGIRELSDFRLKDGRADVRLAGERLYVENLLLTTPDLQLGAKGTVRVGKDDKKVSLDAQLAVQESLVRQLPGMIRDSFAVADDNRRTIDFKVSGTTDKLKTDLLDKLIGQKIHAQFGDLLSNLFGGDKKDDDKKKEEEERKKAEKKQEKERKKKDKEKAADNPANQ
jgi:type II secretion system protein N